MIEVEILVEDDSDLRLDSFVAENVDEISRDEALNQSERINFENESIIGSISLKGGVIDDLTFKNYNIIFSKIECRF